MRGKAEVLGAGCRMQGAGFVLNYITNIQVVPCNMQLATCNMQLAT